MVLNKLKILKINWINSNKKTTSYFKKFINRNLSYRIKVKVSRLVVKRRKKLEKV